MIRKRRRFYVQAHGRSFIGKALTAADGNSCGKESFSYEKAGSHPEFGSRKAGYSDGRVLR